MHIFLIIKKKSESLIILNITEVHCTIRQSFYFINKSILLKLYFVVYFLTNGF